MATLAELLEEIYRDDDTHDLWIADPFSLAEARGVSIDESQVEIINGGNVAAINALISHDGATYVARGGLETLEA